MANEKDSSMFWCQCGLPQTADLTPCPKCHILLCNTCMPFGAMVACVDCADPDSHEYDDVIDF